MKALGATYVCRSKARTNLFDEGSVSFHEGGMITKHSCHLFTKIRVVEVYLVMHMQMVHIKMLVI
jgi:hypothetical protein